MNLGRVGGRLLRQLVLDGSTMENELPHQPATRMRWRRTFREHRMINVIRLHREVSPKPDSVIKRGRPRYKWIAEINSTILALKYGLANPKEVIETLRNQLKDWFSLALKDMRKRSDRESCKKLISLYVGVIDDDPTGFSNLLKIFDFEFVHTPEQIHFVLQSLIIPIASTVSPTKLLRYRKDIQKINKYWNKHRGRIFSSMQTAFGV